jgi:uncharacterized protein
MEESKLGTKPIKGVSTSTTGFLGQTERGPTTPILVTGLEEFYHIYGGHTDNSYLAYQLEGFFKNGGKRCYVVRVTRIGSLPAEDSITLGTNNSILIIAIGPGSWGNRIFFKIDSPNQQDAKKTRFKLTLMYFKSIPPSPIVDPTLSENKKNANRRDPAWLEVYDNISVDPRSSSFYKNETQRTSLVNFFDDIPPSASTEILASPANVPLRILQLQAGTDGDGDIDVGDYQGREDQLLDPITALPIGIEKSGLKGLAEIDDISIVCSPDEPNVVGLREVLIDHCEGLKYRFAILQSLRGEATPANIDTLKPDRESKYAALYFPWK